MKAKNFLGEKGDRVLVDLGYAKEWGVITFIPNGSVIEWVEVEFDTGDYGEYAPDQILGTEYKFT